ncbi:MAG: DNA-directed RNA polymerase subunit beta [Candidatus Auribacterota bacterium]|jgi:DNA-directed RNA polymerase subunit beta|nr:DNA-directed RNA polymerase subunit beta [Candidatus Auribacterota bacterium]
MSSEHEVIYTKRDGVFERETIIDIPNLVEVQTKSYNDFLQIDMLPEKRTYQGLQEVFKEIFPIKSYDESCTLDFVNYSLGVPKYDAEESKRRGVTFAAPLKVRLRLTEHDNVKEEDVYFGNIPLMTPKGTFIINGAERVIVSQLHRSPGICFEQTVHPRGTVLYSFRIIPYRGSWLEVQFDINRYIYIYMDRRRRRRKILVTVFLRALGYSENLDILELFHGVEEIDLAKADPADVVGKILAADVKDDKEDVVILPELQKISKSILQKIKELGIRKIKIIKGGDEDSPIIKMLRKDSTKNQEDALKDIYRKLRPGDPATVPNAKALLHRLFFDPKRYDLSRVGRFKLNKKLGLEINEQEIQKITLEERDIVYALRYLINLTAGEGLIDDIDHLGNRRVRSVGELLQNQCRIGLARMERLIKERMNLYDMSSEVMTPHKLVNPKGLSSIIKDFFGRSQLSQFMDQTNPLAELTHKRRLSALGPGGLSRERAGFEVRDVHTSHYGRICPIETPEGPNIGLIASLSTYGRINDYGFIETPYREVTDNIITDNIKFLSADEEESYLIGQSDIAVSDNGSIVDHDALARYRGDVLRVDTSKLNLVDVSPKQLVSVAAGLIPFLEHDDANRALMGSNMQRQAVPLLFTEAPLVATGLEYRAAKDSGIMIVAEDDGVVDYVDATKIIINGKVYPIIKFQRSNAGTSLNQRPLVKAGQQVKKGQVIADGPGTRNAELALGRNVLVAFMPWGGYNFEDAILISERLVKQDAYTSVHIEEFEIGARDTKLGKEEITRDIPNVGEDALKNLDEDGIIRIGAEVKPGDILVGKITPKSETELSPEERLLRAIFGEKAADVRDASLTVPSGTEGIVIDVKVFARKERAKTEFEKQEEKRVLKEISDQYRKIYDDFNIKMRDRIRQILAGKSLKGDIIDLRTEEIIIPKGKAVNEDMLDRLHSTQYEYIRIEDEWADEEIAKISFWFRKMMEETEVKENRDIENYKKGDELDPGVIKQVKVYIASKRKLMVGDKMAGRHGNKGVIAKILPEEDMPFLPDGTPVDMVLNPLGVPSRMNVGQVLETHLGWAAKMLGLHMQTPVFRGLSEDDIKEYLKKAGLPEHGKVRLFDGRTGEPFDQEIVVGYLYMLKLNHLVSDKIHARAIGPYSLVTQQPLGGKAQFGGQRFGEMEVWAMEAYGAAFALQELLTVKSDDVQGRTRIYESIVKGDNSLEAGTPESFNVLIKEMQSLCLDVRVEKEE